MSVKSKRNAKSGSLLTLGPRHGNMRHFYFHFSPYNSLFFSLFLASAGRSDFSIFHVSFDFNIQAAIILSAFSNKIGGKFNLAETPELQPAAKFLGVSNSLITFQTIFKYLNWINRVKLGIGSNFALALRYRFLVAWILENTTSNENKFLHCARNPTFVTHIHQKLRTYWWNGLNYQMKNDSAHCVFIHSKSSTIPIVSVTVDEWRWIEIRTHTHKHTV